MGSYGIPVDPDQDEQRRKYAIPVTRPTLQPTPDQPIAAPSISIPQSPMPSLGTPQTARPELVKPSGQAIDTGRVAGIPGKLNPTEDGSPGTYNSVNPHISKIASLWSDADNIHNPVLRVLGKIGAGAARAGDSILSAAAPRLAAAIPGTTENKSLQDRNAAGQQDQQAKLALTQATTRNVNAEADQRENPPQKEEDPEKDAYDYYTAQGMNPGDAYSKVLQAKNGGKAGSPEQQAFDSLVKTGMKPEDAYGVVKKAGQTDKPDTAAQDDQRYEGIVAKRLQGQAVTPEEAAFSKAYKDRKTLGQQVTNVYAGAREDRKNARDDAKADTKADTATKAATYKAFTPAMDSAERFNVMADSAEKAIKDHDQQAMLNVLANHLGMTMGLQKGARLNKDIITEAKESRPWLQGMEAKFDKDGYLSGVTLSPEQIKQMVELGRSRLSEDVSKARNESKYMGATDDGPARTANKATIRFYLAQTNGDHAKAKQMAASDGWSIE